MSAKIHVVETDAAPETATTIAKPSPVNLDRFKSTRPAAVAGVETLQTALPFLKISEANDFVRLHPDEGAWEWSEWCFVNVPIKGDKRDTVHLIDEELAMRRLPSKKIMRWRLALATKPHDVFFLAKIPSMVANLDNTWNASMLLACEQAKTRWVQATSRKSENVEAYKVDFAEDEDAFPEPKWPTQPLVELIYASFTGRMIERADHAAILRLIGAKQKLS